MDILTSGFSERGFRKKKVWKLPLYGVYLCICVRACVEHVCFLFFPMVGSQKVEKKSWHFQPVLTEQQFSKCGPGIPGGFKKPF